VIGNEEGVGRLLREALDAVPGHVLDHEKGAVGDEDHVESLLGDYEPVASERERVSKAQHDDLPHAQ
jgi:hypothetical protein